MHLRLRWVLVGVTIFLLGWMTFRMTLSERSSPEDGADPSFAVTPAPTGQSTSSSRSESQPDLSAKPTAVPEVAYDIAPNTPDSRVTRLPTGRVLYNPSVRATRDHGKQSDPMSDLALLDAALSSYRLAYKENPVGVENFEFTEQLLGQNPKQIVFIAPDSPALRGNEIVDRWDTPYFFHALSATEMEIRSAGPDRKLWTEDDLLFAQ